MPMDFDSLNEIQHNEAVRKRKETREARLAPQRLRQWDDMANLL
jgi:hypothetical protein